RRKQAADLAEQPVEILRLDRDHDERGSRHRFGVRQRAAYAVALLQLGYAFLAPPRDHEVTRLAPAGRDQSCEQGLADLPPAEDGDLARGHARSLGASERLPVRRECGLGAEDEAG